MEEREDQGVRRINRSREEGARKRRIRKVLGKTEWFRKGRSRDKETTKFRGAPVIKEVRGLRSKKQEVEKRREIETVLFVPYTTNS